MGTFGLDRCLMGVAVSIPRLPLRRSARARLALPTIAMLESALAALGCASTPHGVPFATAPAPEPTSPREVATPKPRASASGEVGAMRAIEAPPVIGTSQIALPAPPPRRIAVGGAGPGIDPTPRPPASMTVRGGTADDRAVLASARKQVRACVDDTFSGAAVAELAVEIGAEGRTGEIVAKPGASQQLSTCLRRVIRSSPFHPGSSARELAVEVRVEPRDEG
jgi:hypothetical protein